MRKGSHTCSLFLESCKKISPTRAPTVWTWDKLLRSTTFFIHIRSPKAEVTVVIGNNGPIWSFLGCKNVHICLFKGDAISNHPYEKFTAPPRFRRRKINVTKLLLLCTFSFGQYRIKSGLSDRFRPVFLYFNKVYFILESQHSTWLCNWENLIRTSVCILMQQSCWLWCNGGASITV